MGTNKVWNYTSDNYVHRLVQNNVGNKIVEIENFHDDFDEKLEAISLEYTCIVAKELNEQRKYFEDVIETLKSNHEHEVF